MTVSPTLKYPVVAGTLTVKINVATHVRAAKTAPIASLKVMVEVFFFSFILVPV
jgi:hypothetical protein